MRATKRQLAMLRSLATRKGRRETGLFLLEGVRLCGEAFEADVAVELVLVPSELNSDTEAARIALAMEARGAEMVHAPASQLKKISDTVTPQDVLAAARRREPKTADIDFSERARVVALDRVGDPGNVGTIIRTAAWFGFAAVLLGRDCADALNPKVVRASMGGLFYLPVVRDVPLHQALKDLDRKGFTLTAAVLDGDEDYMSWAGPRRSLLLLGSEARGIEDDLLARAHQRIAIPRCGKGDSLNVAVTAAILMAAAAG
jgi:TrmH family RNA methyltransferase